MIIGNHKIIKIKITHDRKNSGTKYLGDEYFV